MTPFKNTYNLYNKFLTIIDPENVIDHKYTKALIMFSTTEYDIRVLFDDQQGRGPCGIRFRDENWTEHPIVKLENYDDSLYFNVSMRLPINIEKNDLKIIVDECINIFEVHGVKPFIIIESKVK